MPKLFPFLTLLACCSLLGCNSLSSSSLSSQDSALSVTSYSDSGIYAILTEVPTGHGLLAASKNQARTGLLITITVTSEPGFRLSGIASEQADLTTVSAGETYTFVMPSKNVMVTASFIVSSSSSSVSPSLVGQ